MSKYPFAVYGADAIVPASLLFATEISKILNSFVPVDILSASLFGTINDPETIPSPSVTNVVVEPSGCSVKPLNVFPGSTDESA